MKSLLLILGIALFPLSAQAADIGAVVQTRLEAQQQTVNGNFQFAANRVSAIIGNTPLNSQQSAAIQQVYASLGLFQQQTNNTFASTQQQVNTALGNVVTPVSTPSFNMNAATVSGIQLNNLIPVNPMILPTDTIQNSFQNMTIENAR